LVGVRIVKKASRVGSNEMRSFPMSPPSSSPVTLTGPASPRKVCALIREKKARARKTRGRDEVGDTKLGATS